MTPTLLISLLAMAIPPEGCDPAFLAEPQAHTFDYAAQIQPIWSQYCADCHVQHGGNPATGLDLEPPFSRDNLVLVPSAQEPTVALVWPGRPEISLLWRKLNCDAPGPLTGGQRMPFGRPPLPPGLQALVYDWIAAGAPTELLLRDGFDQRPGSSPAANQSAAAP